MDPRPVGVFDSGVGGLSVLRQLRRLAPREHYIYVADTAYFPYGSRPAAEVRKRAFAICTRLAESGAKLIVVACNTASAAAIADLREFFPMPFVGMVPGVKPAAASSPARKVVILATPGTLDGDLYRRVVDEFGSGARIVSVPGHGLAGIVEAGEAGTEQARRALREALAGEVAAGADTVVLGCTHYPFVIPLIQEIVGPQVRVVDPAPAVARQVGRLLAGLDEKWPAAPSPGGAGVRYYTSGNPAGLQALLPRLVGETSPVQLLEWSAGGLELAAA